MLVIIIIFLILPAMLLKIYCVLTLGKCSSESKLNGKVALVTGSNRAIPRGITFQIITNCTINILENRQSIGYYTALNLAKRGAKVIITSENYEDLKRAQKEMIKESRNTDVIAKHLNYLSLDNVRSFAKDILDKEPRLDILVNNAGSVGLGHKLTRDRLLPVMQINYFAPFLLTNLLLGLLKKSPSSRIVNVASAASNIGFVFKADNINSLKGLGHNDMTECIQYFHSKICIVSWTIEMAKRLKVSGVTVNCLHPGAVYTKLFNDTKLGYIQCLMSFVAPICLKTAKEGAETSIHLAACDKVEGVTGKYFSDCRESRIWADLNASARAKVWEQSVRFVGLKPEEIQI